MKMFRVLCTVIIQCFMMLSMYASNSFFENQDKYTVKNQISTKRNTVSFLMDKNGVVCYLVKQMKKQDFIGDQLRCVREVLGSYVARSIKIPSQKVFLIPSGVDCVGKIDVHKKATLHTIVPGCMLYQSNFFSLLQVKQWWFGKIMKDDKCGLSINVVKSLSRHKDLPRIVALDTYIGNTDRSRKNIFYDKKRDNFWVIDMDCAFGKNLCNLAIAQLGCIEEKYLTCLTAADLNALRVYRDTLKKLIHKNPPAVLKDKMQELAIECFGEEVVLSDVRIQKALDFYADVMVKSYVDAKKLIKGLDSFFKRFAVKKTWIIWLGLKNQS